MNDQPPEKRPAALAFNIELVGMLLFGPAGDAIGDVIIADLKRAFSDRGVSMNSQRDIETDFHPYSVAGLVATGHRILGFIVVSDFQQGLQCLEEELRRIGLLDHAEIGWQCPHELNWRRYFPKGDSTPFLPQLCCLKTDGTNTLPVSAKARETAAGVARLIFNGKPPHYP